MLASHGTSQIHRTSAEPLTFITRRNGKIFWFNVPSAQHPILSTTKLDNLDATRLFREDSKMQLFTLAAVMMMVLIINKHVVSASEEDSDQIAYLTYYSDDQCRDLTLSMPVLNDVPFSVPILREATQPCSELVTCVVDAASSQCAAVGGSADMEMANASIQIRNNGQEVWECDTSNEAVGEDTCDSKPPDACFASSVFPGCYVRWVTAKRKELLFQAGESCEKEPTSGGSRLLTIFN